MTFSSQSSKNIWLNSKRQEMQEQGLSEEEIENEIDALSDTNWTYDEWVDYYGGEQDDW